MAGIYIHIPFCRRKCPYCNFFSLASAKSRDAFLSALKKEIIQTRQYLGGDPVETIYFGGGTPSVFSATVLNEILSLVPHPPTPSPRGEGEISLEINPEDVTPEFVAELKDTAFNRFSLGVQSFDDRELKFLGREHPAEQSVQAVRRLQEAGYDNISIDLIYGIPGSADETWRRNLNTALSLRVPHISAYALTVEEGTPLAWLTGKGRAAPVDDGLQANQFRILTAVMRDGGYLHYEISNFCLPGRESRHNTAYWQGKKYLGLGPSAHSYDGRSRRWNVSNLSKYIEGMERGVPVWDEELLTPEMRINEYIMTSLRTMWGCDGRVIYDLRSAMYDLFMNSARKWVERGMMREESGVWYLTEEGKLFADAIAADLFV